MCKGSSSSSTIDSRVWDLLAQNVQHAKGVANTPFQPYTGDLRAPMNANQQQAGGLFGNFQSQGSGAINAGVNAAIGATQFNAPQVSAASAEPGLAGIDYRNYNNFSNEMLAPGVSPIVTHGAIAAMAGPAAINRGDVQNVQAQTGLGNLSDYMNPYTQNVIDTTLTDMNRVRQMAIAGNQAAATGAGAYGGSRHGVADAETNRGFIDQAAQTAAQLRSAGFNTAAGVMQSDYDRALQAASANQGADLSVAGQNAGLGQQAGLFNAQNATQNSQFNAGAVNDAERLNAANALQNQQFNAGQYLQSGLFNAGQYNDLMKQNAANQQAANLFNASAANQAALANQQASLAGQGVNLQGAGLLGTLGNDQFSNYMTGAGALNQFGTQEQQNQQAALDAAYQQFLRQIQYPVDTQNVLNSALGLFSAGNGTSSAEAKANQFSASAGLLGNLGSAGILALSDGRFKSDIRTIRYDGRGRRWVSFRYLWDQPGTTRRGVIAQEIECTDPHAVVETPFGKLVDYSKLEDA